MEHQEEDHNVGLEVVRSASTTTDDPITASGSSPAIMNSRTSTSPSKQTNSTSAADVIDSSSSSATGTTTNRRCDSFSDQWTAAVLRLQKPMKRLLLATALHAARHPLTYVVAVTAVSLMLLMVGYATNFRIENREFKLWTPTNSPAAQHFAWINQVYDNNNNNNNTSVPDSGGGAVLVFHANGGNVVSQAAMARNFEALDRVRQVAEYQTYCHKYGVPPCPRYVDPFVCLVFGIPTETSDDAPNVCGDLVGVTGFWFHNTTVFEKYGVDDQAVRETLSVDVFPGEAQDFDIADLVGFPVFENVTTTNESDNNNNNETTTQLLLVSGQSFFTIVEIPGSNVAGESEKVNRAMEYELLLLRDEWAADPDNPYRIEFQVATSFEDEFLRGILKDVPLMPVVAILMSGFTALVFYRRDWLRSQTMLGVGSVLCVVMSLLSGYGVMFLVGVPFTSLTLALLYIVFGIGLDDAFILFAAYVRTDPSKDPVERIHDTMDEVAISIFMTTATTQLAFAVGCFSPVPAIRWLCVSKSNITLFWKLQFVFGCSTLL